MPLPHTFPLPHGVPALPPLARPHPAVAPQLLRLVCGSMQVPPQLICEPGHETWHVPLPQTLPFVHAVPALPDPPTPQAPVAPQCEGLESGSTQMPSQMI